MDAETSFTLVLLVGSVLSLLGFMSQRPRLSLQRLWSRYCRPAARAGESAMLLHAEGEAGLRVLAVQGCASGLLAPIEAGHDLAALARDGGEALRRLYADARRAAHERLSIEYRAQMPAGRYGRRVSCSVGIYPHPAADGTRQVLCIFQDCRSEHWLERLLRRRRQEFRALVERSPDAIARYDRHGLRTYSNQAFRRRVLSWQAEGAADGLQEYDGATYHRAVQAVLESGFEDEGEFTWESPAGYQHWQVRMVPEFDAQGQVCGVFTLGRDIDGLKQTELNLRESRNLLRELSARRELEMRQLRKGIAREMHEDYGQRLSMLRILLSMLKQRYGQEIPDISRRTQEAIQLLDSTIDHMREIVSSIHPAVLNMDVETALEWLARNTLHDFRIAYELQVSGAAQHLDETATNLLFRLVQNALSNVVRHAQASRVHISLEPHAQGLRLQVRDNGKGFDLDRARRDSLGLVAMEELVHMLRGEIVFLSAPGKGTLVEVCFPPSVTADM